MIFSGWPTWSKSSSRKKEGATHRLPDGLTGGSFPPIGFLYPQKETAIGSRQPFPADAVTIGFLYPQKETAMAFQVLDRNGNCLLATELEKVARRFLDDNPERGYRLVRGSRSR
jgi:hypothetical protein